MPNLLDERTLERRFSTNIQNMIQLHFSKCLLTNQTIYQVRYTNVCNVNIILKFNIFFNLMCYTCLVFQIIMVNRHLIHVIELMFTNQGISIHSALGVEWTVNPPVSKDEENSN